MCQASPEPAQAAGCGSGSSRPYLAVVTIRPASQAISVCGHLPAGWNCRPFGSAFGACCCAGKLRSPAPLTASRPHPAHLKGLDGYVNPYGNGYVNPYVNPPARDGVPRLPWSVRITAGRQPRRGQSPAKTAGDWPLRGRGSSRLPCDSRTRLEGCRLRRRLINSAVRLPHVALAICSRTCGAPPSSMAIPLQPCRGQARTQRHRAPPSQRHAGLAPLVPDPSPSCSLCCDEAAMCCQAASGL